MLRMTRIIVPLTMLVVACGESPSSSPPTAPSARPALDMGGASANEGIQHIQDALNAAWAAKSAVGYAAPFAEDANIISPVGTILAGRPAIVARHAILFGGPLINSTQAVTFHRVQMLTGTIAIVDGEAFLTNLGTTTHTLVRWVVAKNGGVWEIEGQQSTPTP
jgi:uncharacterized protein (TIGR02246 family)